jgi:hypothetical protein
MNLEAIKQNEVQNGLLDYLKFGGKPGLKLGFNCFNQFYSHKEGGVTDWTGFPASGKTYFCLEIAMGLSEKYGKRHGLYVPDIGSENEILQKLIKMKTGKDFNDKFNNKIDSAQLQKELPWLMHHFVIFKKKDFKKGVTPINFWEMVCEFKDDGGGVDTGIADSWKNFKHIYTGREDSYLDEVLSIRNEMAESYQKHFHTIAHAVKTELNEHQKGSGKRRVPNAWDIKGGGSWFANGKCIITVDWPDKQSNGIDLHISKLKPEDVGVLGSVLNEIMLDPRRGRYCEYVDGKKCYAFDYEKIVRDNFSSERTEYIKPNFNFDNDDRPF